MGEIIKYKGPERRGERIEELDEGFEEMVQKIDFNKIHAILTKILQKSFVQPPYNLLGKENLEFSTIGLHGTSAHYNPGTNTIKLDAGIFGDHDFAPDEETQLKVLLHLLIHEMVHAASSNHQFVEERNGERVRVWESGLFWSMDHLNSNHRMDSHDLMNEAITEYITTQVLREYLDEDNDADEKVEIEYDSRRGDVLGLIEADDRLDFFEVLTESIAKHHDRDLHELRDWFVGLYLHPAGSLDRPNLKKEFESLLNEKVRREVKDKAKKIGDKDPETGYPTIQVRKRWADLLHLINMEIVNDDQWG